MKWHRVSAECDCHACRDTKSLARELAAKDAEIARLREGIGKLASVIESVQGRVFVSPQRLRDLLAVSEAPREAGE